jgi:tetrahydromethanopterin S-methyltransferase subunit G
MVARSKVKTLPKAVKDWLDSALIQSDFSNYTLLENELKNRGYDISRSGLHRYGQVLQRRLNAVKSSTEAAKIMAESMGDDEGALSGAVIGIVQSEIFEILVNLQEAAVDGIDNVKRLGLLSAVSKSISELTRASVAQKKHAIQIRKEERERMKQEAAATAEASMKQQGLSASAIAAVKQDLLGIAV